MELPGFFVIITEENIRGKYYDFGRDKKKKQEKVYDNDKGYGRNSGGQPDYCCECSTWKNEKNVEGDIEKGAGCDRSIPLRFKYGGHAFWQIMAPELSELS